MEASIHLWPDYNEILVGYRNTNFEELKTLFDITKRLILEHKFVILNVSTVEWTLTPWMTSSLLHDRKSSGRKPKVHVYSDAALCLGKMYEHPEANVRWKGHGYSALFGIDGEPIEFEWKISKHSQHCRFSKIFKTNLTFVKQVQKNLSIESSSCSLGNLLDRKIQKVSFEFRKRSRITQKKDFRVEIGHSSVQEKKTNDMERTHLRTWSGTLLLV